MRREYNEVIEVPESVVCQINETNTLTCKKGEVETSRSMDIPESRVEVENNKIKIICKKANKKSRAYVKTYVGHIKNMLKGLDEKFVYELEICHVHFPMTVKVEGETLVISNFLGEKENRSAKIVSGVDVDVKGNKITVSSHDLESAGQTAANIERASKIYKKDRRVFQDGIFMTAKNGRII